MQFFTKGHKFYPDLLLPIYYKPEENFNNDAAQKCYRLILVLKGTSLLQFDNHAEIFTAPVIFCLNETEYPLLPKNEDFLARAFYFLPEYINSNLNFDNIKKDNTLLFTEKHDRDLLRPFYYRNEGYLGQIKIGFRTYQRILQLFDFTRKEIDDQKDEYWPCRSRSYFLELLFVLEYIFQNPEACPVPPPQVVSKEIEPVITFLLHNYYRDISLAELSETFNINRTSLTERFKKATGLSIISYLIDLRIRIAALLLSDTRLTVSEITERVGFNDASHFSRMFKKYYGYSISEYRHRFCKVE